MSKKKNRGFNPTAPRPAGNGIAMAPPPSSTGNGATLTPQSDTHFTAAVAAGDTVTRAAEELELADLMLLESAGANADGAGAAASFAMSSREEASVKDLTNRLSAARVALEKEREQFKKLKELENRLADQERQLKQRELNAEHGFAEQNRAAVAKVDEEIAKSRAELEQLRSALKAERAEWDAKHADALADSEAEARTRRAALQLELEQMRATAEAEGRRRLEALEARESEVAARERDARRLRTELATERLLLDDDTAALEQRVERRAGARVNAIESEMAARVAERDSARQERDRLQETLRLRAVADTKFGDRTVEDVLQHVATLEADVANLQRQLRQRPSELVVVRNQQLEAEREAADNTIAELRIANAQLESQSARNRVAVTELEAIRDEKKALAKANELLKAALEELKAKVDQYVERVDSQTVFPALASIDKDEQYQEAPPALMSRFTDPKVFANGIRQRIAQDPVRPLYYAERDVRSFLGGLAMSRLHILQGISGTGKTSLPLAFARAVGAGTQLVEVQAGWRDRQDLVGYYNAFERRYYESEFLQALYKAQTPAYADRVFIIVLDEMNLSRPEQYFADLLSALEQAPERRRLTLLSSPSQQPPQQLLDGRLLTIPENVWFVGTANHDETTAELADKTYDRAHVMELPNRPEVFEPKERPDRAPVSSSALQRMFAEVQGEYAADGQRVLELLEKVLAKPMADRFGIAWANRLERQVLAYVPVIVAAGGTASEAADDLVAMKILRKLRNRHDTQWSEVKSLRDDMVAGWKQVMRGSATPERSVALLDAEIQRLRGAEALLGHA
jgi:hypothetical protein